MNIKQKRAVIIAGVAVLAAIIAWMAYYISANFVYHDEEHTLVAASDEMTIAPDFTVFDKDNSETHLSEHIGKNTVVYFWATWNGSCKSMLADFDSIYTDYPEAEFMMINLTDGMDETQAHAKKYIENKEYTVPVYYDLSYSAAHAYHVETLPLTVFIDENGYVTDIHQGRLTKSQIRDYIAPIDEADKTLQ